VVVYANGIETTAFKGMPELEKTCACYVQALTNMLCSGIFLWRLHSWCHNIISVVVMLPQSCPGSARTTSAALEGEYIW
jgi:hypothetical protein